VLQPWVPPIRERGAREYPLRPESAHFGHFGSQTGRRVRAGVGWYCGRALTLFAAGAVLVAMLASFRRLSASAEHHAAHDALTGLVNRRSV
jgi:hypothetical protein